MRKSQKATETTDFVTLKRNEGCSIGFVPTMGALHNGHISLITKAKEENDVVICSIFVNPTQFNDVTDLTSYPKTPENDFRLLEEAGCDLLFEPLADEIYTADYRSPEFNFGVLESTLEGAFRPGHFQGVAMVVYRLFQIVTPHRSYFGNKDFQQLAVISRMKRQFNLETEIIGCETIREADGLAMSSRNIRLSPDERTNAVIIYKTLSRSRELIDKLGIEKSKALMINEIESGVCFNCEYLEFSDPVTLQSVAQPGRAGSLRVFIAVKAKSTRLIDNMAV
jgi:pantoate--beta-alanine ligase